ncbi:MAG: PilZ domain-containing protein, partial [Bdellovibrionia bacterium]
MAQRIGSSKETSSENRIVDFNEAREQRLEQKRRRTERILFRNLVSVYSLTEHDKLFPVDLIEVSEDGCSFQILADAPTSGLIKRDEIPLRIYFSQDTYLEIFAKIVNSRPSIEKNRRYVRYGCKIDKTVKSYAVYQLFVQFLKQYAVHAHRDLG